MSIWDDFTKKELEYISVKNLANPLGLNREPWNFSRGAKTNRHYTKDGNTIIKVEYTYIYPDDGQGGLDYRKIESYTERIYLYHEDGAIFHEIPVPISLNTKNIKEVNRAIRFGRIDYMNAAGEQLAAHGNTLPSPVDQVTVDYLISVGAIHPSYNTPTLYETHRQNLIGLESDMDAIFEYYSQQIYDYKDRGTEDFYNAVINESDQNIIDILQKDMPPDSVFTNGFKIIDAIKYQLRRIMPS